MTRSDLPLSTREVYQILKDIAMGERTACHIHDPLACGLLCVEVDGWQLTFQHAHQGLEYCESSCAPDGRSARLDDWHRYGTNPVDLLSAWEHQQLTRVLTNLTSIANRQGSASASTLLDCTGGTDHDQKSRPD